MTLQVLSQSSLIVSWHTPPGAPNIAASYEVSYGPEHATSDNLKKTTFFGSQNSAILSDLRAYAHEYSRRDL